MTVPPNKTRRAGSARAFISRAAQWGRRNSKPGNLILASAPSETGDPVGPSRVQQIHQRVRRSGRFQRDADVRGRGYSLTIRLAVAATPRRRSGNLVRFDVEISVRVVTPNQA